MLKIITLVLGLILAFGAMAWAIYLSYSDPNALANNAILLFISIIIAIFLILYSQSRD